MSAMRSPNGHHPLKTIAIGAAIALLLGAGCKQESSEQEALGGLEKGSAPAVPEKVEAAPDAGAGDAASAQREEPVATPAREELRLLTAKGADQVRSIRSERSDIYRLFAMVEKDEKEEFDALLRGVQSFLWDESKEALQAAPTRLAELTTVTIAFADKMKGRGDEQMAEVEKMNKENEERVAAKKRPPHSDVKIDKVQRRGSYYVKLGRYAALLARSLFDEARVYATFGSLAMRDDLRGRFAPLKETELAFEQTELAKQRLLWELNVPGVEEPSSD